MVMVGSVVLTGPVTLTVVVLIVAVEAVAVEV
jgi:hypothetical protein